jgi:adenylate cyclase
MDGGLTASGAERPAIAVRSGRRSPGERLRPALDRMRGTGSWQAIARIVTRLAELGTAGYAPDVKRRLMTLNLMAYLIAFFTFGYSVQHLFLDWATYGPVIVINAVLAFVALLVPLAHRLHETAGGLLIVVAEYIGLFVLTAYLGHPSGVQVQYFIAGAAPFVVFGIGRLWLIVVVVLIGLVLHLAAWFMFPPGQAWLRAERDVLDSIYTSAAITTFGLIAATVYYAFRLAEKAKAETDGLLRSILPDSVVDRLKDKPGEPIADAFDDASVLFSDLAGFVALAKSLGPARTVELLNRIVREMDELAAQHGVEKIKTIGDAYMAAAGLPDPVPDHAERLARFALDMQAVIARLRRETGLGLELRIGMALGPVMAGVIGTDKFNYDVWGDTVNLASRLEQAGERGRIHVSANMRERLGNAFRFEDHGDVGIKGIGVERGWFLVGVADQAPQARGAARPSATPRPAEPALDGSGAQ